VTDYGDDLTMMQLIMRYLEVDRDTGKFDSPKLESCVAVTIYSNHFVKVRHSFPMPINKRFLEEYREKRDDFLSTIRGLILDTKVRPDLVKALKKFKESPEDADANSVIMAYAEASKLVHITIRSELLPFLGNEKSKGNSSLLIGFIAGKVEAQLKNMNFTNHDLEGVQQMLETYRTLKITNAVKIEPTLDKWSKLNEDELKQTIEKLKQEN